jgi:hypothetical protein
MRIETVDDVVGQDFQLVRLLAVKPVLEGTEAHEAGRHALTTAAVSTVSRMTPCCEPIMDSAREVGMPRAAMASEHRNSRMDERSTARPSPMRE